MKVFDLYSEHFSNFTVIAILRHLMKLQTNEKEKLCHLKDMNFRTSSPIVIGAAFQYWHSLSLACQRCAFRNIKTILPNMRSRILTPEFSDPARI